MGADEGGGGAEGCGSGACTEAIDGGIEGGAEGVGRSRAVTDASAVGKVAEATAPQRAVTETAATARWRRRGWGRCGGGGVGVGGRSGNGGDEDGGGVVSSGDGGGGIGGVERGGREGDDSDCGGEEGGCATVMARTSVARAAVTMVAGSQEEISGMAEIVTSVLEGAERAAARAVAVGRVAGGEKNRDERW